MKRIYVSLLGILIASSLRAETPAIEEQNLKSAAQAVCTQQCALFDQLKRYVEHTDLKEKKEIIYQLSLLKICVADDVKRVCNCSVAELETMLCAAEFVIENFNKNIPENLAQICTTQPITSVAAEQKSLSTADLIARYNKLQENIQQLIEKLFELDMTKLEKFFDKVDMTYGKHKDWLEPLIAGAILGGFLAYGNDINKYIDQNKWKCIAVATPAYALACYLRAQPRVKIAALKTKLPAALYYPLALCKWAVGSHEKALRVTFPYGKNIDITKVREWVSKQEKRCGVPIAFDEDKIIAPFGFGSLAKLIGMKNEVNPLLSFGFGADGIKGNIGFFTFPSKK